MFVNIFIILLVVKNEILLIVNINNNFAFCISRKETYYCLFNIKATFRLCVYFFDNYNYIHKYFLDYFANFNAKGVVFYIITKHDFYLRKAKLVIVKFIIIVN